MNLAQHWLCKEGVSAPGMLSLITEQTSQGKPVQKGVPAVPELESR